MTGQRPQTLGELKKISSRLPTVREEMQINLIKKLKNKEPLFKGLIGYDDTVIPQLVNAILCGHNVIILGERGQGKSRLIRGMMEFFDDEIPAIKGCPIHDDPFKPICSDCKIRLEEVGDDLPIAYVPADRRLVEKLATSDVSTADLIGEVDPIKIAEGRTLGDETALHFGLVPRANRGIFAINELPDLAEKIQVAFFNVMEENDFQIKGFPVRLPLDILIVASANPEDYTSRGRIITPLKDRFDVQIRTHYPKTREAEVRIMEQEAKNMDFGGKEVVVPGFIKQILAEITFQARKYPEISQTSGVSCRVTIRGYESILGSGLRRGLHLDEEKIVPRVTDLESTYPAIVGKLELEYDAAGTSEDEIVEEITSRAIKVVFDECFDVDNLQSIVEAFNDGMGAEVSQHLPSEDYIDALKLIAGMRDAVQQIADPDSAPEASAAIEFILEGLHLSNKLNREITNGRRVYK